MPFGKARLSVDIETMSCEPHRAFRWVKPAYEITALEIAVSGADCFSEPYCGAGCLHLPAATSDRCQPFRRYPQAMSIRVVLAEQLGCRLPF